MALVPVIWSVMPVLRASARSAALALYAAVAPLEEGAADTVDAAEAVDAADEVLVARKAYGQAEDAADADQPDPNP